MAAAVIPAAVLAMLLGIYIIISGIRESRANTNLLGQALARQIAGASAGPAYAMDHEALVRLAQAAADDHEVSRIVILDTQGHVLAATTSRPSSASASSDFLAWFGHWLVPATLPPFKADIVARTALKPGLSPAVPMAPGLVNDNVLLGKVHILLNSHQLAHAVGFAFVKGLAIAFFGVLGSLVFAWQMTPGLTRSLRNIHQGVRKLGEGKLETRVPVHSDGDLGELEHGINKMAEELEAAHHHLTFQVKQATAELRQTMEELEIRNAELDLARRRAIKNSTEKSEFLATLSHELRTPLNALVGYAKLLAQSPLDDTQRNHLEIIQRAAQALTWLLKDVLSLARLESGKMSSSNRPFDLVELVDETATLVVADAYAKGLEFYIDPGRRHELWVSGDRLRVQQILGNLLGNGIKYTASGRVGLTLGIEHQSTGRLLAEFRVRDTGQGIPPEQYMMVFDRYTRLGENDGDREGTGLGLAITKKLVEAMEGDIDVASPADGGTEFIVTLPFSTTRQVQHKDQAPPELRKSPRINAVLCEPDVSCQAALVHRLEAMNAEIEIASDENEFWQIYSTLTQNQCGLLGIGPSQAQNPDLIESSIVSRELNRPLILMVPKLTGPIFALQEKYPAVRVAPKSQTVTQLENLFTAISADSDSANSDGIANSLMRIDSSILQMLKDDLPADFQSLMEAVDNHESGTISKLLHRMQGTAAFCRLRGLEQALSELKPQATGGTKLDCSRLKHEIDRITHLIPKHLKTAHSEKVEPHQTKSLNGSRILVIDDNRVNVQLLITHLLQQGAQAVGAMNQAEVDDARGSFEAILLDIHMPDGGGIDLAPRLRSRYPHALFIGISADYSAKTRRKALGVGMDHYLTKPVDIDTLMVLLQPKRQPPKSKTGTALYTKT